MLRRGNAEWVIVGRLGRGKRNDRVLLSSNHPVHGRDTRCVPRRYTTLHTRTPRVRACFFHTQSGAIRAFAGNKTATAGEIETINRVRYRRLVKHRRIDGS